MKRLVPLFCVVAGIAPASWAADPILVDDNAPGDPGPGDPYVSDPLEDGSASHPFDTIAEAIDSASPGDTIVLRDGLYTGAGNVDLFVKKDVTVASQNGNARCTVDCQGASEAFTLKAQVTVIGLTIKNGEHLAGGAVRALSGATATLRDCVFVDNHAVLDGGAVYNASSVVTIENCVFVHNASDGNGGAISSRLGGLTFVDHGSFSGNQAPLGGAVFAGDSGQTSVSNSVLWGNVGAPMAIDFGSAELVVVHSNSQGGEAAVTVGSSGTLTWLDGNIDQDPLFVAPELGDLHLRDGSPCIDAGSDDVGNKLTTDCEGDPRAFPTLADIGADEFHPRTYVVGDATPGGAAIVTIVGPGGGDPVLLAASTSLLSTPVQTAFGPYWLGPMLPGLPAVVGPLPQDGVTTIPFIVPPSLPTYATLTMQALVDTTLTDLCVFEVQ